MRRLGKILGILLLVMIVVFTAGYFYIKSRPIPEVAVESIDLSQVADGRYTGEYGAGLVEVIVEIQVEDHQIRDIKLVKHQNGMGGKGEKIIQEILNQQSLQVDAIGGATLSSNVIRRAVQNALSN